MYFTDKFRDPIAKADAVHANTIDMIVGYVIDQLKPTPFRVQTSEDLDELRRDVDRWVKVNHHPSLTQISDFACTMHRNFAGGN